MHSGDRATRLVSQPWVVVCTLSYLPHHIHLYQWCQHILTDKLKWSWSPSIQWNQSVPNCSQLNDTQLNDTKTFPPQGKSLIFVNSAALYSECRKRTRPPSLMSNIRVGCIWQGAVHALVMFPGWPRPRCTHLRQFNPFKHIVPPKKLFSPPG